MMSTQHDFDTRILDITAHRPWPMPDGPWIMTQTWNDLLFAHWPVGVAELRALVPAGFELDLYEGQAWLGIVPFHMTNVAPRLMPALPWLSAFPELNVRTYVRVRDTPGVYFFSLDTTNPVAVTAARNLFHLPYFNAAISVEQDEDWIHYESRRTSSDGAAAAFVASYRPIGPVAEPVPGTLEYFLTERYCLFTIDSSSHACRVDIHHPPWPLQPAEATIAVNTMADGIGLRLPAMAPLLHFSRRQDVVNWAIQRLD